VDIAIQHLVIGQQLVVVIQTQLLIIFQQLVVENLTQHLLIIQQLVVVIPILLQEHIQVF